MNFCPRTQLGCGDLHREEPSTKSKNCSSNHQFWLISTHRSPRSWKLIAHPMGLEVVSYKNMRRDLDLSPFALGHYPTEQRYAQIEKECLASVWACERFDRYLMGLDSFTLYSDHKPLIPLINSKDLSETPLRCQRMLIRLLQYKPVAIHQPGKMMVTSDTLSRSPAACSQETSNLHEDVRFHVSMVTSSWPVSDGKLRQLKEETQQDVSLRTAIN